MKSIKWSSIIIAIGYILSGILFFANPSITRDLICTWIGFGLLVAGVITIVVYFLRSKQESFLRNEFMNGLLLISVGLLALIRRPVFIEIVYLVLAIVIMLSGFKKLQDCVDAYRLGLKYGTLYLALSAISIVIGFFIILDPTIEIKTLHVLIAIGLLYSGLSDLVSTIFLSSKMKNYVDTLKKDAINSVVSETDIAHVDNENIE